MTKPITRCTKRLRTASLAAATFVCVLPQIAGAKPRADLNVSVGALAASNPYLLNGKNLGAAGANLTIDPSIYLDDANTSIALTGNLSLDKYFGKYDLEDSYGIRAAGSSRISERTTLTADVDFRSSKSAANRFYSGLSGNLAGGELLNTAQFDPTLASLTGRTSRLEVNASLQRILNPRSLLTASAGLGLTRVSSSSGTDYRDTHLGLDYARKLTETTSALVSVEGGYADYLDQHGADGLFVTPMIGLDHQITRSLKLSAELGVSVATIRSPSGDRQTTATWAGKLELCDRNGKETACLTGGRSAQPTSLGGLTTVSSVGLSYAHEIGARGNISAAVTYARTSRSSVTLLNGLGGRSELLSASSTFRRKIGSRVSAFVTPSFTSARDERRGRRENYQVLMGISYSFGKRQ